MALTVRTRELLDRLAQELAASFAAATGAADAGATPVPAPVDAPRWLLSVALDGGDAGQVVLGLDGAGVSAATRLVLGLDSDPDDGAIVDTLREFGSQAIGTVGQDPVNAGIRFEIALEIADALPPSDSAIYSLSFGGPVPIIISAWGEVADAGAPRAMVAGEASIDAESPKTAAIKGAPPNLDVILDVDLPISVRFGMTEMALQSLTRIGPGSVIDLARSPDDPVELLISGKVVARGEVVVVMGNYGVRITEVVSTAERIRSMGVSR